MKLTKTKQNKRTILSRTIKLFLIVISLTLGLFSSLVIPYFRETIISDLESQAKTIATSIAQVTASAIILEDYSSVVDHCLNVIKERPIIRYVVITKRKDGFSIIHTSKRWNSKNLKGNLWRPLIKGDKNVANFIDSKLVEQRVLHYTYPFSYSGIDWGWIHIGLSTKKLNSDLKNIYIQTLISLFLCIFGGLIVSYYFSIQLTRPILTLNKVTQQVAKGDLEKRANIATGDELENLGDSFNSMVEALQKTQKELINAKNFTENIITSMIDTLIVINPDNTIKSINQATINLLGYNEDELIGKAATKILASETNKHIFREKDHNDLVKKGFVREYKTSFLTKKQDIIPISFSGSIMKDAKGNPIGIVGVARDMRKINSLIKNLEETKDNLAKSLKELKETQFQLIQSGKMSAIGQLAAGVAHEINNPLSGVLGNAKLMQEQLCKPTMKKIKNIELYKDFIEIIIEGANRCKTIAKDLLSFSRQSNEEYLNIDINDVIEKSLNLVHHQLKHNRIIIKKDLKSTPKKIKGNFNRLQQVFINIILNAQRYAGMDGTIYISTNVTHDGKFVEARIRDTGPGIPHENIDKIFEPFFTTMSVVQGTGAGTGLGLTISYNIIKDHNGTIQVESKEGQGATFLIKIPKS